MEKANKKQEKTKPNKQRDRAFGKDVYLLGHDKDGKRYWLEAAKWDCGWYWGFGYVQTYQNNREPRQAMEIDSHNHFDGVWFQQEGRDYYHKLEDRPGFISVLNDDEQWQLAEYMRSFYTLKKSAEFFGLGGSHVSSNPLSETFLKPELVKEINAVMLPALFEKIYTLLNNSGQNAE